MRPPPWGLAALVLLTAACELPLEHEVSGCRYLLAPAADPVCVLEPGGELVVWARSTPDARLELDTELEVLTTQPADGGQRFHLQAGDAAPKVRIRARRGAARASRELPVATVGSAGESALEPVDGDLLEAYLRRLGEVWTALDEGRGAGEVRAAFERLPEPPRYHGESAYAAASLRALWLAQTGQSRAAWHTLERLAGQAERLGRGDLALLVAESRANLATRYGQLAAAEAILAGAVPEAEALWREGAAAARRELAVLYNNLGWNRLLAAWDGRPLGPARPALLAARSLFAELSDRQELANVETNLALDRLLAGQLEAAAEHLEAARRWHDPPLRRHLVWWLDLEARLALARGEPARALERSTTLAGLGPADGLAESRWRGEQGRALALARLGRSAESFAAFARAEALADRLAGAVTADHVDWSVLARRGTRDHLTAWLAADRPAEVLALVRRAVRRERRPWQLEERGAAVPAGEHDPVSDLLWNVRRLRDRLDAMQVEGWQWHGESKLRADDQAAELALELDRAFTELNRRLAPPASAVAFPGELPSPPGELFLAFYPLAAGWVGVAALDGEVRARALDLERAIGGLDQPELGRRLLGPFAELLARARAVRFLPHGALRPLDLHALPWRGGVLLDALPVSYTLDLATQSPAAGERRAVLVADPTGTLAHAAAEVEAARASISGWPGWHLGATLAGDAADLEALRGALAAADHLHFAGHADLRGTGHLGGGLRLARRARLLPVDLLTAPRLPRTVVLSACEAAASVETVGPGAARPGAASVADAFLLGGAAVVVGPSREVDDRQAARLVARFYAAWDGEPASASAALRQAQLAMRATWDDWPSFRVLVR